MTNYTSIQFHGTFRDYQQHVLDNANRHLQDGKIHIVAAPGSGKTILGLELIRRLGKPALVLSPSVTIRQQWGERFESGFLPVGAAAEDYVSFDLKRPGLITSVTYQALHAASKNLILEEEADDDEKTDEGQGDTTQKTEDFSQFNLLETVKKYGIQTVCLDEAHHLRSEWQKALEAFLEALGNDVKVIALTATPPYDSTLTEWKKYTDLCGEIDEEIFVPQLVAQKTLCPHQDYIYFNYPTTDETQVLSEYKKRARTCTEEMMREGLPMQALQAAGVLEHDKEQEEMILEHVQGFIALLSLAYHSGAALPDKLVRLVSPSKKLPAFRLSFAETAFQFVIDHPEIFGEAISEQFRKRLAQDGLIEKKKVCLKSNSRLNKLLVSSVGKLQSINTIALAESGALGDRLRMLILTDYIKKDLLKQIGTQTPITSMGTVPVFESVRRVCGETANIAMLSGNLVVVPNGILPQLMAIAQEKGMTCTAKALPNTEHSELVVSGSNKNKVGLITEAFQQGLIHILVGTKSLLGEGWDSPCINSLILASFVGSFMLSNQMRGRAIRVDRNDPGKISNIWHLATIEPPLLPGLEDTNQMHSNDFDTVERRFACFLGPAYHENIIESGIERIDILKPPYDKEGIASINQQMLTLAEDRETMASRWQGVLTGLSHPEIVEVNEVPASVQPIGFLFRNVLGEMLFALVLYFYCFGVLPALTSVPDLLTFLLSFVVFIGIGYCMLCGLLRILRHLSPGKTVQTLANCILKTLKEIGQIESADAKVQVMTNDAHSLVYCTLKNATVHEKNIFAHAIGELLSPIDNPRYVLVKQYQVFGITGLLYSQSYACPSVIGSKKEFVEILTRYLKASTGNFVPLYTRNEDGRRLLLKSRKRSYINANDIAVRQKKQVASKWR